MLIIFKELTNNFEQTLLDSLKKNDKEKEFEKRVNPESVIWQGVETKFWQEFLKKLVEEHSNETNSNVSKKILENFDTEIHNFIQVCPKEMIDKLENPITNKISNFAS